ncbi:hypothetical protein Hamer_G005739, partial [Homarus americanus]
MTMLQGVVAWVTLTAHLTVAQNLTPTTTLTNHQPSTARSSPTTPTPATTTASTHVNHDPATTTLPSSTTTAVTYIINLPSTIRGQVKNSSEHSPRVNSPPPTTTTHRAISTSSSSGTPSFGGVSHSLRKIRPALPINQRLLSFPREPIPLTRLPPRRGSEAVTQPTSNGTPLTLSRTAQGSSLTLHSTAPKYTRITTQLSNRIKKAVPAGTKKYKSNKYSGSKTGAWRWTMPGAEEVVARRLATLTRVKASRPRYRLTSNTDSPSTTTTTSIPVAVSARNPWEIATTTAKSAASHAAPKLDDNVTTLGLDVRIVSPILDDRIAAPKLDGRIATPRLDGRKVTPRLDKTSASNLDDSIAAMFRRITLAAMRE